MAAVTDINEIIEQGLAHVLKRIRVEAAYLFGSHVTGEADEDSDIDLAIFTPDVDGLNLVERVHLTSQLALGCDSSLELHLMPSRALANARPYQLRGVHRRAWQTLDLIVPDVPLLARHQPLRFQPRADSCTIHVSRTRSGKDPGKCSGLALPASL